MRGKTTAPAQNSTFLRNSFAVVVGFGLSLALLVPPVHAQDQASSDEPPASRPSAAMKPAVESMAFAATTLNGESVVFPNDFGGKLVLVSFWATWCPVCGREMPFWKAAEERFHDTNLVFVGILTDQNGGSPRDKAEAHVRRLGLAWPQIFEGGADLSHEFLVDTLPHSFLVDGDTGKVLVEGNNLRKKRLMPQLEKAFSAKFPGVALPPMPPPTTQPVSTQPITRNPALRPAPKPAATQPSKKLPYARNPAPPATQSSKSP